MNATDVQETLERMADKTQATQAIFQSSFSKRFFPRLPAIVRNDVKRKVESRTKRANATNQNLAKAADEAVKFGLKCAAYIEDKYPFVDSRNHAKPEPLSHNILMREDAIKKLASRYADELAAILQNVDASQFSDFLGALVWVYRTQAKKLSEIYVLAPVVDFSQKKREVLEEQLTIAVLKMQAEQWLERRLLRLRAQYIEYSQIALCRVGDKGHQSRYVSEVSFQNWTRKQHESKQYMAAMSVLNTETGEHFKLEDVASRTVANPENRRIEMMVRSRGFEELAEELGYTALFITWTLPSKYHRNSPHWNGASVKEGHKALMAKWAVGRARLAKRDIDYFGFRVAEPHKDATSHSHYFLFCSHKDKADVVRILREEATHEDRAELGSDVTPRFDVKEADPSKGGATAYIAKYVSKNINGKHMPESKAEENAFKVRAWASVHGIRQFQQFGGEPVSLWRSLRRATSEQTAHDEKLEALRQAADSSKWSLFCQLAHDAKLEYETKKNQYGEVVSKVIGFTWLSEVIETCSDTFQLVKTKDLKRALETRSGSTWSTENNCNPSLSQALTELTGWSIQGVKCLIKPLQSGAKIQIDQHATVSLRNGGLVVT